MIGYRFTDYIPPNDKSKTEFESLLNMFLQLLVITSGDISEALSWLTNLDKQYSITNPNYGIGNFIEDLKDKGYISDKTPEGEFKLTAKSEMSIRQNALEEIFGKLRKSGKGSHPTPVPGQGDEPGTERREFQFGDTLEQISLTDSLKNAQINHGVADFKLTENDLEIVEDE